VKIAKGRRIPTAMLKIVLRRIFYFPNAVWASASGGFRIVSDTLVASVLLVCHSVSTSFCTMVLWFNYHIADIYAAPVWPWCFPPVVCALPNLCTHILKANEPFLMQIGTIGSRGKGMKRSTSGVSRSKVKDTGGRSKIWRPGALHHSRSSWVE